MFKLNDGDSVQVSAKNKEGFCLPSPVNTAGASDNQEVTMKRVRQMVELI